jgi:hypothetical protein
MNIIAISSYRNNTLYIVYYNYEKKKYIAYDYETKEEDDKNTKDRR